MSTYIHKTYKISDVTDEDQLPLMIQDLNNGWFIHSTTNFKDHIVYILSKNTLSSSNNIGHKTYKISDVTDEEQLPLMIQDLNNEWFIISTINFKNHIVYILSEHNLNNNSNNYYYYGDKNYVHDQGIPNTIWTCNHNLEKLPSVTVVDTSGTIIEGNVIYNSLNQVTIKFSSSFSGQAYFN